MTVDISGSPTDDQQAERVFVVHGRNDAARDAMFDFLRAIGLKPIEWEQALQWTNHASPYIGDVLDVAFNKAQAVVVLMTPDEVAYLQPAYGHGAADTETQPAPQARPNVLFEAGMAIGRDARRTVLVELGAVRPFSDVAGRHSIRMSNDAAKRKDLAQRLKTAGCSANLEGSDWLRVGDFTSPPPPGAGLPLGRRVPSTNNTHGVKLDARYHSRSGGSDRLEIINRGTEPVFEVNVEVPDMPGLIVGGDEPVARLPAGKSFHVLAAKTFGMSRSQFDVVITGRTADGETVREEAFVDTVG